jgi:hypothetical protein
VRAFLASNPNSGYSYYDSVFPAGTDTSHPWFKFHNVKRDEDDAGASSRALALLANGDVLIFGAIDYQTKGWDSYFPLQEISALQDGLQDSRIISINHMAKDTDASKIMAKEDVDRNFAWQNGYHEGDKKASGDHGHCFVDQLIKRFQEVINDSLGDILVEFRQLLRGRAPVSYQVTPLGKDNREQTHLHQAPLCLVLILPRQPLRSGEYIWPTPPSPYGESPKEKKQEAYRGMFYLHVDF